MIGSNELGHGNIEHEFPDELIVGAFRNPKLDPAAEDAAAKRFVEIYSAAGKTACTYNENVGFVRWRKLIYNACLNPICAITNLDSGRIRLSDESIEMLVRPAMEEIRAAAKAMGHDIPEETVDFTIEVDPPRLYLAPSMLADVRKVRAYGAYHIGKSKANLIGKFHRTRESGRRAIERRTGEGRAHANSEGSIRVVQGLSMAYEGSKGNLCATTKRRSILHLVSFLVRIKIIESKKSSNGKIART